MLRRLAITFLLLCLATPRLFAQNQASPAPVPSSAPAPATSLPGQATPDSPPQNQAARNHNAQVALQEAFDKAGNDHAAVVKNLENYLHDYPDSPERESVYRAIVEDAEQLRDYPTALDFAERTIALQPRDIDMMMHAAGLLERQGDSQSLIKAAGYVSRVIDQVEKLSPGARPARVSLDEWHTHQTHILQAVYFVRGRIEMLQHEYPLATKDLEHSFSLAPTAPAAEKLGQIAEIQKDLPAAIHYYSLAFLLPQSSSPAADDRASIRKQLGNVWRQLHGTDAGLGDAILAAYDAQAPAPSADKTTPNKGVRDLYGFVLRQLPGGLLHFSSLKGQVIVLDFWATWCGPCREMEPLFARLYAQYGKTPGITFLAVNADEDESRVAPFVAANKISLPVVFGDGLDQFLGVDGLPTVLVADRAGRIVYRVTGLDRDAFVSSLSAAIEKASAAPQ